jgi:hypothetical protein
MKRKGTLVDESQTTDIDLIGRNKQSKMSNRPASGTKSNIFILWKS